MIRDTFFSAPRFVNLCRKEMVESWKANLLRFVMMYGIIDRKSTRLNSSHNNQSRMPSSA